MGCIRVKKTKIPVFYGNRILLAINLINELFCMFEVENCYGKKRKRKEKESRVTGREGYDEVLSGMAS